MIAEDELENEEELSFLNENEQKEQKNGKKQEETKETKVQQSSSAAENSAMSSIAQNEILTGGLKFKSKKERELEKQKKEEEEKKQEKKQLKEVQKVREEYDKFRFKDWKRKQEKEERKVKRKQEEEKRKNRSRSRSRSQSPEIDELDEDQYVTSNSRARIPVKMLEGQNKEQMAIKMQYLGLKSERKRLLKPSEKFKNIFNFSWDKTEDTSTDFNPLYQKRLQSNLLFGRGSKAGYDVTEQRAQSVNYEKLVHKYDIEYQPKEKIGGDYENQKKKKDIYELGEGDHWSHKKTHQMTDRDWRIFREDNSIIIKGGRVPKPMREWSDYSLPQYIMDALTRLKYKTPTAIQMQAIPIGMERKDMIGIAPTGSGKSCAFLIPLITHLRNLPPIGYERAQDGPYALIMLPTRELAIQVEKEFQNLTVGLGIRSFVIVGGKQIEDQMFMLQKGVELIIGTPGRLKEAIQKKYMVFEQCSYVILDEADEMIDMGLEQDVNYILDSIKSQLKDADENVAELQEKKSKIGQEIFRVTHLFSATFPDSVERIARKYMRSLCYISIGEPGGGKKEIDQKVEFIGEYGKKQRLQNILQSYEAPIIIFANEKKGVEQLAKIVDRWGYNSVVYHGSKNQQQREAAVQGFKDKKYDILIATDLAGRGLHVEGVTLVINFDAPKALKDFVHRTGRTGRAGKKGTAITFLTSHDEGLFFDLNEYLIRNGYDVPMELSNHEATKSKPGHVNSVPRHKQIVLAQ